MITFDEANRLMEDYVSEQQKCLDPEFSIIGNELIIVSGAII